MYLKPLRGLPILVAAWAALFCSAGTARAQFDALISRVPTDANSIIAVDTELLEASPLAKKEGWKNQIEKRRKTGAYGPHVRRVLTGASVEPTGLKSNWEFTVIELKDPPNMTKVAEQLGSSVDNIGGFAAVETAGESFVVRLADHLAAILHPANRQRVARWLSPESGGEHSEYLSKSLTRLSKTTQLVAALDLKDITTAENVKILIQDHESFEKQQKDLDQLAKLIASVQGLAFDLQVNEKATATLRVDFDEQASILSEYRELMVDLLADMGISAPEFKDWNASASGRTWLLQGNLTRNTLDRLMALADTRFETKMMGDPSKYPGHQEEDEASKAAKLALNYFHDVGDILAKVGDYKGANANLYARWFRRHAEKLEELPTKDVDPELVDFALGIAQGLRRLSGTLRGISSRKVIRQTSVNLSSGGSYGGYYGGYRYGGYGYYSGGRVGTTSTGLTAGEQSRRGTERRIIGVQERSKAAATTFSSMDAIAEQYAELRRHMTDKYKIQF